MPSEEYNPERIKTWTFFHMNATIKMVSDWSSVWWITVGGRGMKKDEVVFVTYSFWKYWFYQLLKWAEGTIYQVNGWFHQSGSIIIILSLDQFPKYGNDFTTLTWNTLSGPFCHLHSEKISLTQFCSLYVKSNKTGTDFKIKIAHSDSLCLVCAAGIL